jgi:hypothetical protein
MQTLLRAAAGGAGLSLAAGAALKAGDVPLSYHEAGHTIVAHHLEEAGVFCSDGAKATFVGRRPLLRFTTIVPRTTDKGQRYVGETKLTVRWRDMASHVAWSQAKAGGGGDAAAALGAADVHDGHAARLVLARIAYLFGGRAAEDRLASGLGHAGDDDADWRRHAAGCVARLLAEPGKASGDLRQAQQLKSAQLQGSPPPAGGAASSSPAAADGSADHHYEPALVAAYEFADRVLCARWRQVGALSGALLVRGCLDGVQLAALLEEQRRRHDSGPRAGGGGLAERVLDGAERCGPLVFGAAWAAIEWPGPTPTSTAESCSV